MKKYMLTLGLVVFSKVQAGDFSEVIDQIENSTVLIRTLDDDDSSGGLGTGFFINDTGLLVTNAHVIEDSSCAIIQLANGSVATVNSIKAVFPEQDIAFLNTSLTKTQGLKFDEQGDNVRGVPVGVLGNPKGLEFSFSTGVISALRKSDSMDILQFTAPVSTGSSGSPIFNSKGEVLGIVVGKIDGGQNLNLGLYSKTIQKLLQQAYNKPQKKWVVYDPFRDARPPTQGEMTIEAVTDFEQLEVIHQKIYDEILLIYQDDVEFVKRLRECQRAWIKYRDAYISSRWLQGVNYGSVVRMVIPNHLAMLTQSRIEQLLEWRQGHVEGQVDSGTIKSRHEIIEAEKKLLK